jgi:hypothetical protein
MDMRTSHLWFCEQVNAAANGCGVYLFHSSEDILQAFPLYAGWGGSSLGAGLA